MEVGGLSPFVAFTGEYTRHPSIPVQTSQPVGLPDEVVIERVGLNEEDAHTELSPLQETQFL